MNCPNCGAPVNQGDTFCGTCRTNLSQVQTNNQPMNNVQYNNSNQYNNGQYMNTMPYNNQYMNNSQVSNRVNKNAKYSLICSIVCIFIFWWLGIAGVIYGITALGQIKQTNEKGKILAIFGIVLGAASVILFFCVKVLNIEFSF